MPRMTVFSSVMPETPGKPTTPTQSEKKAPMDAIVNPNSSPATILLDQKDGHREGYTGKDAAALAGMHILNDIHTGSAAGIRETAEASRNGIRETAEVGRHNIRETSETSRHLADLVTRNLAAIKDADIHDADRLCSSTKQLLDSLCEVKEDIKDHEIRNADRFRAVEKDFGQVRFEMVSGFKESLLDSAKNTAAIQLEASKNAAAAALAACTNTAAIQAAIAECCCEQKELLNSLNTQNLQRELSDAKAAGQSQDIVSAVLAKLVK